MATNLALDDKLIAQARRIGGHRTKKEAVTAALEEYVSRRRQLRLIKRFGTIEYAAAYDYKQQRGRKRT